MPAMFAETIRNTRGTGKEQEALTALMSFLSRALQPPQDEVDQRSETTWPWYDPRRWLNIDRNNRGRVYERDVSCARKIISSDEFKLDPSILDTLPVPKGYFLSRPHANQSN